jgi:hypothetical protein
VKLGDIVRHNASNILFGHPHLRFKNMVGIIVKIYKPQEMQKPTVVVMTSSGKLRWLWDHCEVISEVR